MSFWDDRLVLVTGGRGFLGKWVCKVLQERNVPLESIRAPSSKDADFRRWDDCVDLMEGIDVVIHLAARDGGLGYNLTHPGSIYYDNAIMGLQLMEAARQAGVSKFVSAGSVCAYPQSAKIPLVESSLWDGYPDVSNAPYCLAKKMGLVQAQAYRKEYNFNAVHLLLTNMYGPGDVFDPIRSRSAASLIRKFVDAVQNDLPEVHMWGTGNASREYLYVEDAAEAFVLAAERYNSSEPVNIGSGQETTMREMVDIIGKITGYKGSVIWDTSKPEGQMRRCSDVSRAEQEFGFQARTSLECGLRKTIEWYLSQYI